MDIRVLVVDDESVTRRVVTHTLKAINVEVVGAETGTEALELAQQTQFGLIIVDINLPDIDGFEVVRQMKAMPHMQQVPMIMFTARNHGEDESAARDVGAVGFIYKPFSTHELRDIVKRYLGE